MNVRAIPRIAFDGYLRLVRAPVDGAIALLPGNGTGAKPAARIAVDRVDARLRSAVAMLLGDPVLRQDAVRRRAAAEEREHALRLRVEAERKGDRADARLEQRDQEASRQREQARKRAEHRRQQARRREEQTKYGAATAENQRLSASRRTAERREQAIDEQARRERLETLGAETEALDQKEKEIIARDEARRLSEAAGRAKAERQEK